MGGSETGLSARLLAHDGPRLLVINNMPAYYRTAPFKALIDRFASDTGGVGLVAYQVRRDSQGRAEWFYTPDDDLPYDVFISSPDTKPSAHVTRYPLRFDVEVWRRYRPTHVFAAGWDSPLSVTAAAYARVTKARLGVWVESNPTTSRRRSWLSDTYRRSFLRSADFAVVPTASSGDYVRELAGAPIRLRTLLNPVDWPRIADREGDIPRLVFLGDLSRRKGFDHFVTALASDAGRSWEGVAWGRDTEGLAATAPLNCHIKAARPLAELIPELTAADVVAIPSRVDPAPLTFSEALALGLRVLVSDRIAYGADASSVQGARAFDATAPRGLIAAADGVSRGPRPSPEGAECVTPEHWAAGVVAELAPGPR